MKKNIWIVGILVAGYLIASNFFIDFFPATEKELTGSYESSYEGKVYRLVISSDKMITFEVKKNDTIIYQDICKDYNLGTTDYRTFSVSTLSFYKCQNMDSNTILKRDLFFNILIGNNGSELKRIDPDANVFYRKIHTGKL